ncbi:hypothetical protein SLEP1_g56532 [Rubroshorea leprosula]|uniref:Integrase catalytic domain-containing protein n=1 Tax=Rubroshorea leprosula TaxID=152421 RepID=A0AAV5MIS0_9ROSI|nr:hypothetical protein SLEP1_g56532 [Rubroshorea leprosula]
MALEGYLYVPMKDPCSMPSKILGIRCVSPGSYFRTGRLSQARYSGFDVHLQTVPSNLPPHPPPPIPNTFPHVDHAEGGDENQPHNSAHNSAFTTNQDVVATQLAAMQQQFGVFQLVLAQLLARNNLGDPLINLLNHAPQPLAPPQNLEPIQHALAISESQGQSHIAPVQQPLHDDVTRRLDSLEKLVAEQRGAPPSHPAADSVPHPLNTNITLEPYPAGFRIPQLETYDGTKDPDDHLHAFYSCMQAQNASDALMCKIFPSTLRGNARTWYYSLPPRSISSYTEMASAFATKCSSRRLIRKTMSELMLVKQRDGESLKNFMSRFNDAVLEVNSFDQAVGITAVISSLSHERFRDSMLKHPATTFSERAEQPRFVREQGPQPQGVRNPPNRQEVKHQNRAQKRKFDDAEWKNQPITFTSIDLNTVVTPHNDPLVTSVTINNCEYDGPIYGFNNQSVPVEGVLTMNVAFGSGRSYVTPSVRFLVVKMASSFNVVIGRPTLTEIRAVVSQSHLCMKFPTLTGITMLRGNQEIGTRLSPDERTELIAFSELTKMFLHGPQQICREFPLRFLNINSAPIHKKPVVQKWRLFGGERLTVIKEEVEKLLQAGFVRRVDCCEWVANPVPMAPEDEEKTSFYAGNEIYCYVMMPFGLNNAGAIYQKMVTIVFQAQIGRNLEVYVDDIVVKSLKARDHLTDLEETFNNLRKNIMRLNSAKCIFGESGKFLGFMVSRRGIEVNLEKIKVVAKMEPPKSVKDIQRLTGRVAALHRFISKSADKCLPFFKIMSVLHRAKLRYSIAEKVALAVVTSARKLRSYFQSHPIVVLIDQPLRLIKWAVELGEFEITFQQRSAIRAQALADFIVECTPCHLTPNPEPNEWTLYVDGASSNKGSGACALLIGPDGYPSDHALKFNFDATNNVADDSQLVVNQINSICEVVDPVMVKYVALVAELKCRFQRFCLSKIPRAENEQVDSLFKFASDSSLSFRSVFVEVLDAPSFTKPRVMEISTDPDTPSWTDFIFSFLRDGVIPEDKQEAMKLRKKASRYTLVDGVLYKRSFSLPLLRCLNPYEAEYALREVNEGVCGSHVGPFMKGVEGVTHLIVGVDYFTKWVEARALSSLTSKKVKDFVFSSIICRYGIPNQIVADNGTQFNCSSFRDFCSSYGIKLQFTSVYHLESIGMVESVNKCILEGIKPRLEQHKAKWADELNNVLKAYRTTSRTATGETPYHLAFGTKAVIPIEIGVPCFRVTHFDEGRNGQLLRENLDLLNEAREEARLRTLVYKQKIANFYNKRVRPRTFKVGEFVLRKTGLTGFETRFGKLAPNWEGPYTVAEVPHSGAYILQDTEGKRVPRV